MGRFAATSVAGRPREDFGLDVARAAFAADVREGLLRPTKKIPPRYFYDAVGSALFEAITELPEYGLTRAEERILRARAADLARLLPRGVAVAELGPGSGRKTVPVLDALVARQCEVTYTAIDVSAAALESCGHSVAGRPGVRFRQILASYLDGLRLLEVAQLRDAPLVVLFLGSAIGNFEGQETLEFLRGVRARLRQGDALVIGADLKKSVERLLAAYDDPLGVTAAFNLNLLSRINRELGGDFDVRAYRHEARWSEREWRIEMHLLSLRPQVVTVRAAGCRVPMAAGETIWTESCRKFDPAELSALASSSGFTSVAQWTDPEWPFTESLWLAGPGDA